MGSIEKIGRTVLLWLVALLLLFLLVHTTIFMLPPNSSVKFFYWAGDSDCAELAEHMGANNPYDVPFVVTPAYPSAMASLCFIELFGSVSGFDVGDANRPVLRAALNLDERAGVLNQELIIKPVLGDLHGWVVFFTALILSVAWLWWFRLRSGLAQGYDLHTSGAQR